MFRNRWVRRAFAGFLIVLALAVGGLFVDRYYTRRAGEKRLAEVIAHIDATDPRWRYEEIDADRGTLPDAENSTLLVPKFKAALAPPPFHKDPLLDSDYLLNVPPNHVLEDERYDALNSAIVNNAQALVIADSFRKYPKGLRRYVIAPNYIDTPLPDVQDTRLVSRLLDLAAERDGRDGRGARALAYIPAMMNTGRSLDGEPFLIAELVRLACDRTAVLRVERTLALCQPRNRLADVQRVLRQEADSDLFWYSVRGERAGLNRLFTNLRRGVVSISQLAGSSSVSAATNGDEVLLRFGEWFLQPYHASDQALSLDLMTEMYEARQLPENAQRAALDNVVMRIKRLPPGQPGSLITRLILPAVNKIHDASLRTKAHLRCAVAGIAVERFRIAHGRWPDSLEQIPKDLLETIPLDPFDGKPLKYGKRADGVTVYSIGLDEQDDGGAIPIGKATNDPGQDVGFRLYNPDQRGLPAVPRRARFGSFGVGPNTEMPPDDVNALESGPEPRTVGSR